MRAVPEPQLEVEHWPTETLAKAARLNAVLRTKVVQLRAHEHISSETTFELLDVFELLDQCIDEASAATKSLEARLGHEPAPFSLLVDETVRDIARDVLVKWLSS